MTIAWRRFSASVPRLRSFKLLAVLAISRLCHHKLSLVLGSVLTGYKLRAMIVILLLAPNPLSNYGVVTCNECRLVPMVRHVWPFVSKTLQVTESLFPDDPDDRRCSEERCVTDMRVWQADLQMIVRTLNMDKIKLTTVLYARSYPRS